MPSMTDIAATTVVVGGAIGMAALTGGGAGVLIGSGLLGAGAYKTHDVLVGGMYDDAESCLKKEIASCDKEDKARRAALGDCLAKAQGDRCIVKAASVAVGVGTFLCPPLGLACCGAMVWGANRRLKR
jgi:hypothetical protein